MVNSDAKNYYKHLKVGDQVIALTTIRNWGRINAPEGSIGYVSAIELPLIIIAFKDAILRVHCENPQLIRSYLPTVQIIE